MEQGYIDGSTGYKRGTIWGKAFLYHRMFRAESFKRTDLQKINSNDAEQAALRFLLACVSDRPIMVITDSTNVCKFAQPDVLVTWVRRRSIPELQLVDAIAKLAAITNRPVSGEFPEDPQEAQQLILDLEKKMANSYWYKTTA
jgi:hypothetical protein